MKVVCGQGGSPNRPPSIDLNFTDYNYDVPMYLLYRSVLVKGIALDGGTDVKGILEDGKCKKKCCSNDG